MRTWIGTSKPIVSARNLPVFQTDYPVGQPQEFGTMRNEYNTHRVLEVRERNHELFLRIGIQRSRWLVEHEKTGLLQ